MQKPKRWQRGDKIAIVSLSSGLLGEEFVKHNLEIATKRLKAYGLNPIFMENSLKGLEYIKEHPEKRAADLKAAFANPEIKGIICAIGGDDTYRTLPHLLEDQEFKDLVQKNPKIFCGFSDTTINHLMFYQLGLTTYYGPSIISDIGEISAEMLPYTQYYFENFLAATPELTEIHPSPIWYEERQDFSAAAIGTNRVAHQDNRGFELLQGAKKFSGQLLGGCLDSFADFLGGSRYPDEVEVCQKYQLLPSLQEWQGKILFIETSEEKPTPEQFATYLSYLQETGIFEKIRGILLGKPQNEMYSEEYKIQLQKAVGNPQLPIVTNVNFGHSTPRCVLPYGVSIEVNIPEQKIIFLESPFEAE